MVAHSEDQCSAVPLDNLRNLRSHQRVLTDQSSMMGETVLRALADPLRLRLLTLLAGEQLCTCHLVEETGATQTNLSNHLRVLRDAGLVETEPAGRYTYYRVVPDRLEGLGTKLRELAASARGADKVKRPCG
jgi:ArsR family transcriptional regulator